MQQRKQIIEISGKLVADLDAMLHQDAWQLLQLLQNATYGAVRRSNALFNLGKDSPF